MVLSVEVSLDRTGASDRKEGMVAKVNVSGELYELAVELSSCGALGGVGDLCNVKNDLVVVVVVDLSVALDRCLGLVSKKDRESVELFTVLDLEFSCIGILEIPAEISGLSVPDFACCGYAGRCKSLISTLYPYE